MKQYPIRRVPWTCQWGRFGLATEEVGGGAARVDDTFWACHHPTRAPNLRLVGRGECERCPGWQEAARLHDTH